MEKLFPSRVSPAHSAVLGARCRDQPQEADALATGSVFSLLFANNSGTNSSVA